MKATKTELPNNGFRPFKLEIEVESKEEAQALYAIFNKTRNAQLFGRILSEDNPAEEIKLAIGAEFYVGSNDQVIGNGVTYSQFYNGKI